MQTLYSKNARTVSNSLYVSDGAKEMETHKLPSKNIPVKATFLFRDAFSFQTIHTGNNNTIASADELIAPAAW